MGSYAFFIVIPVKAYTFYKRIEYCILTVFSTNN